MGYAVNNRKGRKWKTSWPNSCNIPKFTWRDLKKNKENIFPFFFSLYTEIRKGTYYIHVRSVIVLGQPARYGVSVNCGGGINCGVNAKSETESSQNL